MNGVSRKALSLARRLQTKTHMEFQKVGKTMHKVSLSPSPSVAKSDFVVRHVDKDETQPAVGPGNIECRAFALLEAHPHFQGRSKLLQCQFANGRLYLSGRLPTYYLKQVAQEALRELDGVNLIENRILVAGSWARIAPQLSDSASENGPLMDANGNGIKPR